MEVATWRTKSGYVDVLLGIPRDARWELVRYEELRERDQQIEHLKFQLAKLRRARFGQSSEQIDSGQLPLTLEELIAAADAARELQSGTRS